MKSDEDDPEDVTRVKLLTVNQAAELLSVSRKVAGRLVSIGELKAYNVGQKHATRQTLRVDPRSVDALLHMRETKGYLPDRRCTCRARYEAIMKTAELEKQEPQ